MDVFYRQYSENSVYKQWCDFLKRSPKNVKQINEIPFLPIEFFRSHRITTGEESPERVEFFSSTTTSLIPSKHIVNDISVYENSFMKGFRLFYGDPAEYCILALLPNYLQRTGSSLVYMCNKLIQLSRHPYSGFFLDDMIRLKEIISSLNESGQKTLLIGVSYALMDLADLEVPLNENIVVMETGGMKGRRPEMLKPELHQYLKKGFCIKKIHSEYGMTELLSQAYSFGDGKFISPPWLKFLIREVTDPLTIRSDQKTGGINVIDLANVNSCAFIATKDLGRIDDTGKLELMGRYDESDVRGCNLMVS
jgi:hypothetical protein